MTDFDEFGALEFFLVYYMSAAAGFLLFRVAAALRRSRDSVNDPEEPSRENLWQLFTRGLNPVLAAALFPVFWPLVLIIQCFVRWMIPNILSSNLDEHRETSFGAAAGKEFESFKGRKGEAVCDLHPSGRVAVEGELLEAVSRGEFIQTGTRVRVTATDGFRVVVEKAD